MTSALIIHDIRSCHNVGSLLRTADGIGVSRVYLTGYTPCPLEADDKRLPHIANKIHKQIHKTALGAEKSVNWSHHSDVKEVIQQLHDDGWVVAALEQTSTAVPLNTYGSKDRTALLLGREVEGIEPALLKLTDIQLEIPMAGQKESFNVVQAAAMALYHLHFLAKS